MTWTRQEWKEFFLGLALGPIGFVLIDITASIIKWNRRRKLKGSNCPNCGAQL